MQPQKRFCNILVRFGNGDDSFVEVHEVLTARLWIFVVNFESFRSHEVKQQMYDAVLFLQ